MAINDNPGATPLDRMAARLDRELACPKCGYEDGEGHWKARTTGAEVVYSHVCPGCGAVRERTLHLDS